MKLKQIGKIRFKVGPFTSYSYIEFEYGLNKSPMITERSFYKRT